MPPEPAPAAPDDGARRLAAAVAARARRRGLRVDLDRLRYANAHVYGAAAGPRPERSLYVGVGHGHDALLALLDGLTGAVVGVDPYVGRDGNDDADHRALVDLCRALDLGSRFVVERATIEDYLASASASGRFDLIVCNDVLHHVFTTAAPLSASPLFGAATELFRRFAAAARPGARLALSEVQRHGLRPLVHRLGLAGGAVDYRTKQPWREWCRAAEAAGWRRVDLVNYVPFALRGTAAMWRGGLGRVTLCDRYFLHFQLGAAGA